MQFDSLLDNALNIAIEFNVVIGEQAWFRILEFLQDFIYRLVPKISGLIQKQGIDDKYKIDKVKDLVDQRKTMVLRNLPENISLQRLTEQLELDFKEINTIYENKVQDYRENQKYLRLSKKLQEKELAVQ